MTHSFCSGVIQRDFILLNCIVITAYFKTYQIYHYELVGNVFTLYDISFVVSFVIFIELAFC